MSYQNIPAELRRLKQWVCAGTNKIPLNPRTGKAADPTDPATWGTYEEAIRCGKPHIGFVLSKDDPYSAIDLDLPADEAQAERNRHILEAADSYAETSQSGNGVHIFLRGKIPAGRRKDNVEVYSQDRYMIMTGRRLNELPIDDNQFLLDVLYKEMATTGAGVELHETEEIQSDDEVVAMAERAHNGAKFKLLWDGQWEGEREWPSHSEADMALMAMLCYYSKSNEQCRRLFRQSGLGGRDKAQRDKYLDYMVVKCRAKEPTPVSLDEIEKIANSKLEAAEAASNIHSVSEPVRNEGDSGPSEEAGDSAGVVGAAVGGLEYPPGFVGRLADYFYSTSIRPVKEIALASALAYAAGVCGRSYNVSNTGLNQYIILLAQTGCGKEGLASGIDTLVAALRSSIPMADRFIGPASFASGQALVRELDQRPCFVSVLGEFGKTLQAISDPRATEATAEIKRILLDIYNKSGFNKIFRGRVHSDSTKNTKMVQAPNVTILGESTPEVLYGGLDASQITDGLLPRFSIIEYKGMRPHRNRNAFNPPDEELLNEAGELLTLALTTAQNNTCQPVNLDAEATAILDELDEYATDMINQSSEVQRNLWNRAHMKALKLSALVAVGCDMQNPVIGKEAALWARDFAVNDIQTLSARFESGDVGEGHSKQEVDIRAAIADYANLATPTKRNYKVPEMLLAEKNLVPYHYLRRRLRQHASFRNDRRGFDAALSGMLTEMVRDETLIKLDRKTAEGKFNVTQELFAKGPCF